MRNRIHSFKDLKNTRVTYFLQTYLHYARPEGQIEGPIKIGSTKNFNNLIARVRGDHYEPIRILCVVHDMALSAEAGNYYLKCCRLRNRRDWYAPSTHVLQFIDEVKQYPGVIIKDEEDYWCTGPRPVWWPAVEPCRWCGQLIKFWHPTYWMRLSSENGEPCPHCGKYVFLPWEAPPAPWGGGYHPDALKFKGESMPAWVVQQDRRRDVHQLVVDVKQEYDNVFAARAKDYPEYVAHGPTVDDVLDDLQEVLQRHLGHGVKLSPDVRLMPSGTSSATRAKLDVEP